MPYTPIKDIAGANSAIADLYGRADAAMKALAQGTSDWGSILGKPSTFPPSTHTHNYLPTTGGTIASPLRLNNDMANWKTIYWQSNGVNRWALFMNNDTEGAGEDHFGSTLTLNRYKNNGDLLSTVLTISRSKGEFTFRHPLRVRDVGTHNAMIANSGVAGEFLFGGSHGDGGPIGPYLRIGRNKLWFYDDDLVDPKQYIVLHTGHAGSAFNPVYYPGSGLDANIVLAPFSLCSVNTPTGTGSTFAWVFTMCYPNITTPTAKAQLSFSYSAPASGIALSTRRYYNSAWTPWANIPTVVPT